MKCKEPRTDRLRPEQGSRETLKLELQDNHLPEIFQASDKTIEFVEV
jgi:hypothetical protein